MIPLFKPSCSDLEIEYVTGVLRSGWWGLGPKTEELEEKFAAFTGARYAVATNSATAALQLALAATDATGGDVIVPALTFVSSGLAALQNSNRVVFADVREDTLCIDWEHVAELTGEQTRAIMPVWYGGNVERIPGRFRQWNITEDCAHAAGAAYAGTQGSTACWSFHAVKNIAAGDGGMVTTDSRDIAERVKTLRWCGIDRSTWDRSRNKPYGWDYDVTTAGYKAHMNDITAALALAQMERLSVLNDARKRLVATYLEALDDLEWLQLPEWAPGSSWHLFVVRVAADSRNHFIDHMLGNQVSAGVHYKPLNLYEIFGPTQPLPVTDRVWKTLVTLPLYPDMTQADQEKVITAVRDFKPGMDS
jgi:perosamine synthetase